MEALSSTPERDNDDKDGVVSTLVACIRCLHASIRCLPVESQQSSVSASPELMKRFELLLQCGF
jgi:hypothetical protein